MSSFPEPGATYRVQLHPDLGLDGAADLADYLADLGVTHIYLSPVLKAAPGSTHGYDVVDPTAIDDAIGGDAAFDRLARRLGELGMGMLVDIVPNHMSTASPANPWWWDVLARGADSRYASYFDIEWAQGLEDRVLVPVLARPLPEAIEAGEVMLARRGEALYIECAGHELPLQIRDDEHEALLASLRRGQPNPERLMDLLGRQSYSLTHWRRARTHLNYRRFFTITSMISVRVEDPEVFEATHAAILGRLREGQIHGLRVDHPDGLRDPHTYFERLAGASDGAWTVVEKILAPGERLRSGWRAAGTTGYEFAAIAGELFVDPRNEAAFTSLYAEVTGEPTDWEKVSYQARVAIMRDALAPEIERLSVLVEDAVQPGWPSDLLLSQAVVELVANMPVYRTYSRPDTGAIDDADIAALSVAAARARQRRPDLASALGVVADCLELRCPAASELVWRLQQTSSAVMAKGVEDTALYTYNRFIALNEVGADPSAFGVSADELHAFFLERQARWPLGLNTLSTHDTKRSVDVRARLYALSEYPEELAEAIRRWIAHNRVHRQGDWPDRNAEYLLYQTLIGAHPLPADRACAYMEKAAREAHAHTSWTEPNAEYEHALREFTAAALADPVFAAELAAFVERLLIPGRVNSLALTLLCATAPGVPDVYQGTELWDLSLVDPDNRRPVDFEARRAALAALRSSRRAPAELDASGGAKLWLLHQALTLRRRWPEVFGAEAAYRPLFARGPAARHLFAFARHHAAAPDGRAAITCVPRLTRGIDWQGTTLALPAGSWRNLLTGDRHRGGPVLVSQLLSRFPVALCCRERH